MLCNIINTIHTLDPGGTPSDSASHPDPNYVQRSKMAQTILKLFGTETIRFRL